MAIKMYELAGATDDRCYSPYCWRIRMALAHKNVAVETIPWRFTEKERIAFSDAALAKLNNTLQPIRKTLKSQPFIAGKQPNFAGYIIFAPFQWARTISPKKLLATDDPIYAWRDRMLSLYDGLAAKAKGYVV